MKTYISKPIEVKAELFNPDRIEEYRKMGAEIENLKLLNGTLIGLCAKNSGMKDHYKRMRLSSDMN